MLFLLEQQKLNKILLPLSFKFDFEYQYRYLCFHFRSNFSNGNFKALNFQDRNQEVGSTNMAQTVDLSFEEALSLVFIVVSIRKRNLWCDIRNIKTLRSLRLRHIKGSACLCLRLRRNENQALVLQVFEDDILNEEEAFLALELLL